MTGWPSWLDSATTAAVPDRTCVRHLGPFERCRSWHRLSRAKRDGLELLQAILDLRWVRYVGIG